MLVVAQIAPADSGEGRTLIPNAAWTATGTSHQSEAAIESNAVRHASEQTARPPTGPVSHSYRRSKSGPSSTQPVTAALTPPPVDVSTRANSAGHHHRPGVW